MAILINQRVGARLSDRSGRSFSIPYSLFGRCFTTVLGVLAIAWGVATFPIFWWQGSIERTAAAIINRDTFKPGALDALIPAVQSIGNGSYCRPSALRSAAIIRLRLAERAMVDGERNVMDVRLASAERSIRQSLTCAPSDAFLWMALAWVDEMRRGFRERQLTFLRLSYRVGPNEGWVAARRNRLALSMFTRLPPDLAGEAVNEFDHLLNSWIYWDAIAIFEGPGWPIHDQLLASLKDVGKRQREAFADELYAQGFDLTVPGVAPRQPRPWY
jgi:hypothetical protein